MSEFVRASGASGVRCPLLHLQDNAHKCESADDTVRSVPKFTIRELVLHTHLSGSSLRSSQPQPKPPLPRLSIWRWSLSPSPWRSQAPDLESCLNLESCLKSAAFFWPDPSWPPCSLEASRVDRTQQPPRRRSNHPAGVAPLAHQRRTVWKSDKTVNILNPKSSFPLNLGRENHLKCLSLFT